MRRSSTCQLFTLLALCLIPPIIAQPEDSNQPSAAELELEKRIEAIDNAWRDGTEKSFHLLMSQAGEKWFVDFLHDEKYVSHAFDDTTDPGDVAEELFRSITGFRGKSETGAALAIAWLRAPNPTCRARSIGVLDDTVNLIESPHVVAHLEPLAHDASTHVRRSLASAGFLWDGADASGQDGAHLPSDRLLALYLDLLDDEDAIVRFEAARRVGKHRGGGEEARRALLELLSSADAIRAKAKPGHPLDWGAIVSVRTAAAMELGRMKTDSKSIRAALPVENRDREDSVENLVFRAAAGNSIALAGDVSGFLAVVKLTAERNTTPYAAILLEEWDIRHLRLALANLAKDFPPAAAKLEQVFLRMQTKTGN